MAKIGEGHARDMLRRGLSEMQAMAFWGDSNVAQPVHDTRSPFEQAVAESRAAGPPAAQPEMTPERGHDHGR